MNKYYVDAERGLDTNVGSLLQPLKTIAKANSLIVAGDMGLLKCGVVFPESLAPVRAGDAGNEIIYTSYGIGLNPKVTKPSSCSFFIDSPLHHIRVEHINFSGSTGSYSTVYCYNAHDITFYDCRMGDALTRHGLSVNGSNVYGILIEKCLLDHNYMSGTYTGTLTSDQILFRETVAEYNGHNPTGDHGFYIGGGTVLDRCIARYNSGAGVKMNDNEKEAFFYPVLKNSECYGNNYGVVFTHKNALAFNNELHDNNYNALFYGNQWGGYKAYFNTLANGKSTSMRAGMWFGSGFSPNSDIRNNLVIQDLSMVSRGAIHFDAGISMVNMESAFDHNVYYTNSSLASVMFMYQGSNGTTKSWNNWISAGAEPHGTFLLELPDLVNQYTDLHPLRNGNLVGKGIAIAGYEFDRDGNKRLTPPTPGCYEVAVQIPVNPNADEIEKLNEVIVDLSKTETILVARLELIHQNAVAIDATIEGLRLVESSIGSTYEVVDLELINIRKAITDIQETIEGLG